MVYGGTHKNLPWCHPYRWTQVAFNGKVETRNALVWVSTTNTFKGAYGQKSWLANTRNYAREKFDHVHKHKIKRWNGMFELPY
jgi:hypothetical protein